jgi:uncharacterized membrane protein YebE (DUF533 family)
MIAGDLLYELSTHVLVSDTPWADVVRMTIGALGSIVAVLLAKMYWTGRVGGMSGLAAIGAVLTYAVVAWAQIIAFSSPVQPRDLTSLNVAVLVAMIVSLAGCLQAMHVGLFRGRR